MERKLMIPNLKPEESSYSASLRRSWLLGSSRNNPSPIPKERTQSCYFQSKHKLAAHTGAPLSPLTQNSRQMFCTNLVLDLKSSIIWRGDLSKTFGITVHLHVHRNGQTSRQDFDWKQEKNTKKLANQSLWIILQSISWRFCQIPAVKHLDPIFTFSLFLFWQKQIFNSCSEFKTAGAEPTVSPEAGSLSSSKHSPNQVHLPMTDIYFIIKKVMKKNLVSIRHEYWA